MLPSYGNAVAPRPASRTATATYRPRAADRFAECVAGEGFPCDQVDRNAADVGCNTYWHLNSVVREFDVHEAFLRRGRRRSSDAQRDNASRRSSDEPQLA